VPAMISNRSGFRAVFDCIVFLQGAARREGASGACLGLIEMEVVQLLLSGEIIDEVRGVLDRPRVRQKFPQLTDDLVSRFLTALGKIAMLIPEVPRAFEYERDPKDEPYIYLCWIHVRSRQHRKPTGIYRKVRRHGGLRGRCRPGACPTTHFDRYWWVSRGPLRQAGVPAPRRIYLHCPPYAAATVWRARKPSHKPRHLRSTSSATFSAIASASR
jgi:predicted nucleic acid-binding protein